MNGLRRKERCILNKSWYPENIGAGQHCIYKIAHHTAMPRNTEAGSKIITCIISLAAFTRNITLLALSKLFNMKKHLTFAFLFIISVAYCQEPVCKKNNDIAEQERRMHEKKIVPMARTMASSNFNVGYYKCYWNVNPSQNYISGYVTSYFELTADASAITYDLSFNLTADSVVMNDQKLLFSQFNNNTITVNFPENYNKGTKDSLTIYYRGQPVGSGFGSFIISQHGGVPVMWTLSEPYGARDWWPCRNGLDDKADSIDIYVEHPSQYVAASNGIVAGSSVNGGKTITHFHHSYAIASYLVAFAVTNYTVTNTSVQLQHSVLPIITYAYPESANAFNANTYKMLDAMKLFDSAFVDYPFAREKYGQTQFGWGGGMEHQTNSFVISYGENLMAHELAHQWFGDRITCGSWQDIWLNEGFATFCADFLYTERYNPVQYKANVQSDLDYVVSVPSGSVKVDDTTSTGRIFDGRLSYDKGAFLLRMLRFTLGDEAFFNGLRSYLQDVKLKYGFARTNDLQKHLEDASGKNLNYFFKQWFEGQGYPSIKAEWYQANNNEVGVYLSQTTSHPSVSFYKTLVQIKFKKGNKEKTFTLNHKTNNQFFTVKTGFKPDEVIIDPDKFIISKNNTTIKINPPPVKQDIIGLRILDNPFTNKISVVLPVDNNKRAMLELFDSYGHRITSALVTLAATEQNFTINIPGNISKGNYMLVLRTADKTYKNLLIKN